MKRESKTRRRPLLNIRKVRIGLSLMWVLVLSLLMLAGCTQTDVEEDVIPPRALKDVDAGFSLNVLANQPPVTRSMTFTAAGTIDTDTLATGINDTIRTRAASPLGDESQIVGLWVGQYDVVTGNLLFSKYIPLITDNKVNVKLKQSGAESQVWFVANAGDLGEVATEKALKEEVLPYSSTGTGLPNNSLCMMVGTWKGIVQVGGIEDITVSLTRLLAKITFTYSVGTDFAFTPTSVVLKNAPTASQVVASTAQLTTGGIRYKDYAEASGDIGTAFYWYLPENMAGTVVGANEVDAEKKKIGTGVSNATCIELTGNAEQGGVTYTGVTFRFYPGSNYNNYDIVRNSHYMMNVTLIGIDVSDERITVGGIPPVDVSSEGIPAKGGEKEILVTARPGDKWEFDLPDWMSALLDDMTNVATGATLTHQGPGKVAFIVEESNPKAEKRSGFFDINLNGEVQQIEIVQTGSTLTRGSNISLAAEAGSENSSSFTATEGLPWLATLSDDWLDWSDSNSGTSGSATPTVSQALHVKSTVANPLEQSRSGKITVKIGASVLDASYDGLKEEITVTQAASSVKSTINPAILAVAKDATGTYTLKGTEGLPYNFTAGFPSWLTVTDGTAFTGGGTTTGEDQQLTYKTTSVNPNDFDRVATVTVKAGEILKDVVVKQAASTFSVSDTEIELPKTATSDSVIVTGTPGLLWTVTPNMQTNGITPGIIEGTADGTAQILKFSSTVNPGDVREQTFTIAVTGGNQSKKVKVKQRSKAIKVTIDQSVLKSYLANSKGVASAPSPFDYNGTPNYHN